ncbi:MAG TPA: pilus assembly protein [Aurantimonas coralicida]|uniref:Pilus assembly protein n=2 Tax=root TaxID=1 RepID=A0A9C9NG22_9HYPH|nr:pilus assembly protein [Aurantimonas coralicida]HEU00610.1 pilus assembly protein [Aurantimonas coralicida]
MRMIRKFADSQSGNFAIMTALLAIPLIGAMGLAVDYSAALSNRSVMQDAADSAALATVKAAGLKFSKLSESDKAALIANGKSFFASNEKINAVSVAVTINQAERSVTVTGAYDYPLAFPIFGQSFPMEVLAKAVVGPLRSSYCMIGLSQTASKAISFGGSSDFIGPQCSVHSNSISSSALFQSGGVPPRPRIFAPLGAGRGNSRRK